MNNFFIAIKNKLATFTKKQKIKMLVGLIVIFILLIVLIVFLIINGKKITNEEFESVIKSAAKEYYNDNKKKLPDEDNPSVSVSIEKLVNKEYMKKSSHYIKDKTCSGRVEVYLENEDYYYQPILECISGYQTKTLLDVINEDNEIVQSGAGLYEQQIGEEKIKYFRGDKVNNFVKFSGDLFRIYKIDEEDKILLVQYQTVKDNFYTWDDRYNVEKEGNFGINTFNLSRALTALNDIKTYESLFKAADQKRFVNYKICIDKANEGESFSANKVCKEKYENNFGLLSVYDYMLASLDPTCLKVGDAQCQNYNYLANPLKESFWTLTGNNSNTYEVWKIRGNGQMQLDFASSKAALRYTFALDKHTLFKSGTGTEKDPYLIR